MSEAKQATPHSVLIEQLMDSRVPKTEREHAARREIEMLRDALRGPAQQAEKQEPNEDYERGFVDGMQEQMKTSVDRAVNATCKREWVGLTEEDWKQIWFEFDSLDTENDFQDYMAGKYGAGHYTDADMYWRFQKKIIEAIVNNKLRGKGGGKSV